jgi:hypothetical protein
MKRIDFVTKLLRSAAFPPQNLTILNNHLFQATQYLLTASYQTFPGLWSLFTPKSIISHLQKDKIPEFRSPEFLAVGSKQFPGGSGLNLPRLPDGRLLLVFHSPTDRYGGHYFLTIARGPRGHYPSDVDKFLSKSLTSACLTGSSFRVSGLMTLVSPSLRNSRCIKFLRDAWNEFLRSQWPATGSWRRRQLLASSSHPCSYLRA